MKKILLLLTLVLTLTACKEREPTFHDTQGHAIHFSSYRGKWIIINYWAKWCHNCAAEVGEFNRFYHQHNKAVLVLGVNYDILPDNDLHQLVQDFKIEYPVLKQNPAPYFKIGSISFVPTTVIINPEGKVVKQLIGPQTRTSLEKAIFQKTSAD